MSNADTMPADAEYAVTPFTLPGWDARLRGFHCGTEVDIFALVTQRFLIFVDTSATPEQAATVATLMRDETRSRQPLVILTHADYDHAWGNAAFAPDGTLPALIVGHALTRERLLSQRARDELAERLSADPRLASVRLIVPDIAYTDSLTVDGGDLTIELLHTPGHTSDHTVVWIPALRTLLAGDAVERPWPYVHNAADVPIIRATLARLLALGVEQLAICHGGVSDPALITANIAYFDQMERRCRAALAATPELAEHAQASDGEALEVAIGWPYAEALREVGTTPEHVDTFYQRFHQSTIRATLGWLATQR